MHTVLIADKFSRSGVEAMRGMGLHVVERPEAGEKGLPKALAETGAGILIVRSTKVTAEAIKGAPALQLIVRAGAGYDTIDVRAASSVGVYVSNCPGKNAAAVAELAWALILGLDRRIPENTSQLREGKWNKKEFGKARGLLGRTLGVVGVGTIGRLVIERGKAFGMKVAAWSRSLTDETAAELGVRRYPDVVSLARESDVLSVHVAMTPDTKRIISKEVIAAMKPGAMLINTARGEVVDTQAMIEALKAGKIRAGLDVYEGEPGANATEFNLPLRDVPNWIGTHHIGASTDQAQEAIAEETVRIIRSFVTEGRVPNCVNLARKTPARAMLTVRHYDRVGVLASVLDLIRKAEINAQQMENIVFEGAEAAVARIQLDRMPEEELLSAIRSCQNVLSVSAVPMD